MSDLSSPPDENGEPQSDSHHTTWETNVGQTGQLQVINHDGGITIAHGVKEAEDMYDVFDLRKEQQDWLTETLNEINENNNDAN